MKRIRTTIAIVYFFVFMVLLLLPTARLLWASSEPDPDPTSDSTLLMEGSPVSLGSVLKEALARRPALNQYRNQAIAQKEVVSQARSAYFPQLSASYQNTYGNSFLGFFLFPGYQYFDFSLLSVTLNQTIYDFGRTSSRLKGAKWESKKSKSMLNQELLTLNRDVTVSYLNLLKSQHDLVASDAGVKDARHHLKEAEARLSAGVGIRLDVTQARVNLESALLLRIRAENTFRTAQIELARNIGIRKNPHYLAREISLDQFKRTIHLEADIPLAYQNRPDLKVIEDSVKEGEASLDNAKSQNYPSLNGIGQYFLASIPQSALGLPYIPSSPYSTFNLGGILTIPLFEGGLVTHQVHEARARLASQNDQLQEAKLGISSEVQEAALAVRESRQKWDEARIAYENARENDNLVEKAFQVGTARSVDVVDAETSLRQSREDLIEARYDWAVQMVRYRFSLGDLTLPIAEK
ncbi:MAG: TolC family protein [Leptospirales bacterium]